VCNKRERESGGVRRGNEEFKNKETKNEPSQPAAEEMGWNCAFPNFQTIRHSMKLKLLLRDNAIVGECYECGFFR
jgi:hypothetical protein